MLHVRSDKAALNSSAFLRKRHLRGLSVTHYAQLVRLGYVLVSIVIARFDVTLDAFFPFLRMLGITLLGVNAARRRHLLDADARTGADADANAARRRARCRRRRRRRLVVLIVPQTTQETLVNWLWRGL